jgi:hypothetical protein
MLTILGPRHGGYFDRIARRTLLQIGGLTLGRTTSSKTRS